MSPSPDPVRILAFSGSARAGSWNKKVLAVAVAGARAAGAEVTVLDLREHPLPLYDGDLEAERGLPEEVLRLKALFREHQALLIASPEYNSTFTPLLKNTLDWVSRAAPGEGPLACYQGKVAGLVSASPGALGGLRGLGHVRALLAHLGLLVVPEQVAVSKAHEAFDEAGALKDGALGERVAAVGRAVATLAARLRG